MKPIYKEKYPHLFEPLVVGKKIKLNLKTESLLRLWVVHWHKVQMALLNDFGVNLYGDFAKGGFGLVQAKVVIPMLENNGRSFEFSQ